MTLVEGNGGETITGIFGPLTFCHKAVPIVFALPFKVVYGAHRVCTSPAIAVEGAGKTTKETSSDDAGQTPLVIDYLNA